MKKIIIILIGVILLSILFFNIDNKLVRDNKQPIFMLKIQNHKKLREKQIGLFYILKRDINKSFDEELVLSNNLKFGYLFNTNNIKYNFSRYENDIAIKWVKDECTENLIYSENNINIVSKCIKDFKIYSKNTNEDLQKNNIDILLNLTTTTKTYPQYSYTVYNFGDVKILKCNKDENFTNNYYLYPTKHKVDKDRCKRVCLFKKTVEVQDKNIFNDKYIVNLINLNDNTIQSTEVSNKDFDNLIVNERYYLSIKSNNRYEVPNNIPDNIKDTLLKIEDFNKKVINSKECL